MPYMPKRKKLKLNAEKTVLDSDSFVPKKTATLARRFGNSTGLLLRVAGRWRSLKTLIREHR
jgi:hypothetical protein